MYASQHVRQDTVAAHGENDARGRVVYGKQTRENACDCSEIDDLLQPGGVVMGKRNNGVCVVQERLVVRRVNQPIARRDRIHDKDIENADDYQSATYGETYVSPRVPRFFAQCRGCIEADKREAPQYDPQPNTRKPLCALTLS